MTYYMAIKLDLIRSRRLPNRSQIQEKLLTGAIQANSHFYASLAAEFVVTHGDEVEGMLVPDVALDPVAIVEYWLDFLLPLKVRFGIGYGTLSTKLQQQAIGMDGPAWYNAQIAIEQAKKQRSTIELVGFGQPSDEIATALGNLLCHLRIGWTDQQRRVIGLLRNKRSQNEVAKSLGISAAAVSKHLSTAGWRHYEGGREALLRLLAQCRK